MAFSDNKETMPKFVTNYYFWDGDDSAISFTDLPIQFDIAEEMDGTNKKAFLRGIPEGGIMNIFIQVIAWKLLLEDDQPHIMVLSKADRWIGLKKPRKCYGAMIKTILMIFQFLHFLKKKPRESVKSFRDHLCEVFGMFAFNHFKKKFREYIFLLKLFTEKDSMLTKAPLLLEFLNEAGAVLCDSVCAICDDGGELLCCEGRCMRSFHATVSAGEVSGCNSLGYSEAEVKAFQIFLCKNCQYNQHQCFACGKLGSSDKSADAEVFCCVSATCGRFYHPKCAAELLCPDNESKASKYQKRIEAGKSFICPVHKCIVCGQRENKEVRELQFAICRRCPKSYHRMCLPREIAFEDTREGVVQRAWDGLLPNCTLMFCLNHTVVGELTTPVRDHLIFPDAAGNKKIVVMQNKELDVLAKKIVDKLQWYMQDGDMVVDLCCDGNAFSQLMKEELDASGKICHFQSCDIMQPKNVFNFEKRDKLQVKPGELSVGSKLIMVLNPPFGIQADVANQYIDKALTFKPKLLILTVPEETERLDRKCEPYDLIWEDGEMLSEKSFTLSVSVDVNDHEAEHSNLKPPVLYLWSHPTWTNIYEDIAMEHGHTSTEHRQHGAEEGSQMQVRANAPPVEAEAEECRNKNVAPDEGAGFGKKRSSSESHEGISCKQLKSKHHPHDADEGSQV